MTYEAAESTGTDPVPDRSYPARTADVRISPPVAEDAAEIHDLIAACPPLDGNSLYANLIQCTHFAESCAVARSGGRVIGWISGHRPPAETGTYFLWQVAVHPDARGTGLARQMLAQILARPAQSGATCLQTSITCTNAASWALFRSISGWLKAPMRDEPWFHRERHFHGRHDTEFLVTIGPFAPLASSA
ncbi:diaminobutyrate acetyltransferase [Hyphomonas sp.]|uniref:diaminobutyrate acetyltransferase n=1 Tax=Hyphomonas sp. TaxID=87 RepID=UPI0039195BF7